MNKEKGITLISLIVSIIVLLILAGVTIATLTGDNGLLTKAGETRNTNIEAEGLERIQLAVMASRDENGINTTSLAKNLSEISGLTDTNNYAITENTEITLPKTLKLNNFQFKIIKDGTVTPIKTQAIGTLTKDNYGDYIDLGLSVVGTTATTDDWRILYNDENEHVYAILADYLPNSNAAVIASGLNIISGKTYNVNSSTDRQFLLDKLNSTTAWQSLISEDLRSSCQVKGATNSEILLLSYNKKYNIIPAKEMVNTTYFYIDNDSSKGIDTLYMPHPGGEYNRCFGYWLASPNANNTDIVWYVDNSGNLSNSYFNSTYRGLCPVVSLPSTVQVINREGIWCLVE